MSALEEDSNAVAAEAPAVAVEADDSNAAAPPPPLPPAANNAADNNIQQDDTTTAAAPMIDLSPYFNTLIDSLHRNNDNDTVANSAPAAAAAAATANGSNSNSNAPQLRSMMVSLLWNGVELIATAGRASFGQQQQNQQQGTQFVVETVGGDNNDTTTAASSSTSTSSIFPPKFAAVYLYAVAQNIVALEEIVLQQERLTTADGNVMDVLDGGVSVKQVAEIISAASIAAIFCNSRDIISKSGILPALSYLIESIGSHHRGGGGGSVHAFTPFHPEFMQICLLAGQYRYAQSFLQSHPVYNMTLDSSSSSSSRNGIRPHPTMYLRYHYYAGLVHIGCDDWNSSLDSFYLCITIPCQAVSAISIAARKKSLLVECILLEAEEMDNHSGSGGKKMGRSSVENRVLDVPGAASQAVSSFMTKSSNRVGVFGGDDTFDEFGLALQHPGGSETSEQPTTTRGRGSSRRRMRTAASNISSDGGDDGAAATGAGGRKAKSQAQLGRYHELVSTYISGNANHCATLLTEMSELLRTDGNWGLAKRLEGRLVYRAVRQKASVYSVTRMVALEESLQKVCSDLGLTGGEIGTRRSEDLLMGMMACDWEDPLVADPFVATMDHSSNMVSFQDDDTRNHEAANEELEKDLSNRLASCVALAERVRTLDIGLSTAPKYQQHANKQKMLSRKGDMMQGHGVADMAMDISTDW